MMKLGIQLYSCRINMEKDPINTIKRVSEIGYKYLELANLRGDTDFGSGFGVDATELKKILNECGCSAISTHISPLNLKNIDSVIEYYSEIGASYICSKPEYGTTEQCMKEAELYDRLGEKCHEAGIQHVIHSGLPTYCEDGTLGMSKILESTNPQNVMLELDTYWVMRGGIDPIDLMGKHADRIVMLHQKDCPADFKGVKNLNSILKPGEIATTAFFDEYRKEYQFCEIGSGIMPLQKIIDFANENTKAKYLVLEQDFSTEDEFASVAESFGNLRKHTGIEFE